MTRWLAVLLLVCLSTGSAADTILHTQKSLYRNIEVYEDDGVRCLRFSLKRRASQQSCLDTSDPDRLVLPYTAVTFGGLAVNPKPQRVLLLGLGAGTIVNVFATLFPGITIDAVEIDPAVVRVARDYFDFAESDGTRVMIQDGRVFTRRALRRGTVYDYIIVDAFTGDYIPEHMMTVEFLEQCRQLLNDNGVLVANTFSTSRLYDSESATYAAVFGEFLNLRRRFSNRIIVAARDRLPSAQQRQANIASINADLSRFGIDLERIMALDRGKDWRVKARVLTDQYSPANLLNQ